jgi:hypothetical protein
MPSGDQRYAAGAPEGEAGARADGDAASAPAAEAGAAKRRFKARVREWAGKLGVDVRAITVRSLTTKWASCSTTGRLTFDAQVAELSPSLQDYVIVHELLHFSTPNHGRLWKSLMHAHLGDYESAERELKHIAADSLHGGYQSGNIHIRRDRGGQQAQS